MSPQPLRFAVLLAAAALAWVGTSVCAQTPAKSASPSDEKKGEAPPDYINADRPGIADGSTVIGPKRFQLEIGYQNEFRKMGTDTDRTQFFPTLLRFGIDSRLELRVEGNNFISNRHTTPGLSAVTGEGISPTSLGVKFHFQDQKEVGRKASLGAILRVFPTSGSGDFAQSHTTADLRLAADWDFTPSLSLNPNIGIGVYEDGNGDLYTAGLLAMTLNYWNRARTVNPFVDFGFQGPEEKNGRASLIFDAGIAVIVKPNVQLDFSIGTGSLGNTSPHPFLSAGVSVRF